MVFERAALTEDKEESMLQNETIQEIENSIIEDMAEDIMEACEESSESDIGPSVNIEESK